MTLGVEPPHPLHPVHTEVASGPRRRRPAARPPSVQRPIYRSGRVYLAFTVVLVLGWLVVLEVEAASQFVQEGDRAVVEWIAGHRDRDVVELLAAPTAFVSSWLWRVLRWATLLVLVAVRRVRHLAVYCGVVLAISAITNLAVDVGDRTTPASAVRDAGAAIATHPSRALVTLSLSVVGAIYTLAPRGRARNRAKRAAALLIAAIIASRLYLTVEYPTDVLVALVVGVALPVVVFRYMTPNDAFPIRYRRGPRATGLDAGRVSSIRAALAGEFGWDLETIDVLRPVGSAGSTPMRIVVRGDAGRALLFAKLYSLAHLRSDRWYKAARAVLYGRLEDEAPFADIRHLVEHEDYLLRVAADGGLPVPVTHGVIEVTPGREYLLLMEWLPNARQLSDSEVTDDVIEQGFAAVAQMWRIGLAHRDIKPANLVVVDGKLHLVDLSFAELNASPWRQAVDLGVMTLCLALYAGPARVLAVARQWFTPDELGEALASAHAVTIPAQLRAALRERDPTVPDECRRLVPTHRPIAIQRWSVARVALTAAVAVTAGVSLGLAAYNVAKAGLL